MIPDIKNLCVTACVLLCMTGTHAGGVMGVDEKGSLLLNGKPVRSIGVNYFDAFRRRLMDREDVSYRQGFRTLARYEIPLARFMAGGFWPNEWELYTTDREKYFDFMDDVVKAAGEAKVGLIPSLFWWYPCVPDLVGEAVGAWGNPESETHAFMRRYVEEMVTRYRDNPAIWAWEFGNEYNLSSDLPNAMEHLPWAVPDRGTPAARSEADVLTGDALLTAMTAFAEAVRLHDPVRPITSGHAILRASAYHQRKELSWKRDSREEHIREMLAMHPDPMNLLSTHIYPEALEHRYFDRDDLSYRDLLDTAMEAARRSRKPLFVGEFGVLGGPEEEETSERRVEFEVMLRAIVDSGAPMAALWVFDFAPHADKGNVDGYNALSYRLEMIQAANREINIPIGEGELP